MYRFAIADEFKSQAFRAPISMPTRSTSFAGSSVAGSSRSPLPKSDVTSVSRPNGNGLILPAALHKGPKSS
jgi:hypothetical protein